MSQRAEGHGSGWEMGQCPAGCERGGGAGGTGLWEQGQQGIDECIAVRAGLLWGEQ